MRSFNVNGLVKAYKGRTVVNGVSLSVNSGEVVGLLGANGAGKTTTFYMIVGLVVPDEGSVLLDGDDLTGVPMYERARRGIGYLPQEHSVFRKLTVEQNLQAILEYLDISRGDADKRCKELMDELGIAHIATVKGYALSGGERRRVEIARALVNSPAFLLLDEPFSGIDPIAVEDIQGIVTSLTKKGIGVLITDHNVGATLGICDRAFIIDQGRILKDGTPAELLKSKRVRDVYLGEKFRM
ncbi:Lipopolysaccharide ABC transporter, ATP-binding protein LptB [hydrothermal vent metagenome]|uniref:Lipopolysaccharide ABC transporter, ATP-binding protein LptB n=1 Tax=hydrothermal vent metagenome TaxID=652676 RepID=A0A3B0VBT6_9ZZZZ